MQIKILSEIVKIFDIEPFEPRDGGDTYRLRLEVTRDINTDIYSAKVYRLETYRLQPTFPQTEGCIPGWQHDALVYVSDDTFNATELSGESMLETIEKFQKSFNYFFAPNKLTLDTDWQLAKADSQFQKIARRM